MMPANPVFDAPEANGIEPVTIAAPDACRYTGRPAPVIESFLDALLPWASRRLRLVLYGAVPIALAGFLTGAPVLMRGRRA
jgi:hypothetical protein